VKGWKRPWLLRESSPLLATKVPANSTCPAPAGLFSLAELAYDPTGVIVSTPRIDIAPPIDPVMVEV
jgi:hypothetical protein